LAKQRLGALTVGSVNWRALAAACALCRGRPLTLTLHYTAQTPTPPACCLRGAAWHLPSAPLRTCVRARVGAGQVPAWTELWPAAVS